MTLLFLKLVLVPALVACVTIAGRRWGIRVGGLLTALPMVAGPALCFYAIEQGDAFAASAARTTLLGISGTATWCVVYSHCARRFNWLLSLLAGWSAFAVVAALMYGVELGGLGDLALTSGSLLIAQRLLPSPAVGLTRARPPGWDVPMRMLVAAALVLVLTSVAGRLGPRLSGLMAAFPIVTVIIAAFTHAQYGPEPVASYFRGLLRGLYSFALFCFVFSVALGPLGLGLPAAAFSALVAQLSMQGLILWRMSVRSSPVPAGT